jgi:alkanesulfonate monooxygenase SsuD/methylene tetrahydromethanopterin reductase-like flavin-dependent oxidoreductase (luciferase family)
VILAHEKDILMAPTPVTFGFLLPTREIVMSQQRPDLRPMLILAERAEALGFDSVWVGESILARPRQVLANEVANVDLLSQGRLILGLGIATKSRPIAREFAACGVAFSHRVSLFEEGVTLMRRLWAEPQVTASGRHFQLEEVSLGLRPLQQPGVPLWLAGSVDNALRRVLRLGNGWFPNPASPQVFAAQWERLQALAQDMGQDAHALHRCVYTTLNINDDEARAEQEMRAFVEGYYHAPYDTMVRQQGCARDVLPQVRQG